MIKEGQTIEVQGAKYFVDYVEYFGITFCGEVPEIRKMVLKGIRK